MFLSNVHCYGNENKLTDCNGASLKYHTSSHSMDMGVVCTGKIS